MKTQLYKDSSTDTIMTFGEVKQHYAETNNSDLPIDDDTMRLILFENLVQNGGNIIYMDDEILTWCNSYAEYMESDRYLSQKERDSSIKDIYIAISSGDPYVTNIKAQLSGSEGLALLFDLQKLVC